DDFTDVLIGTNSTLNWYANTGEILVLGTNAITESQKATIVYPNPTTGQIFLENSLHIETIEVYDAAGKLIERFQDSNTINLSELNNGIYFLKMTDIYDNSTLQKVVLVK
ncbi:MAG: hypothetical protein CMC15_03925, partial [Flavobacteriaceae bacterium]|nr:hypothetical protein [Flavobacteriaceae bacterium]